MEPLTATVIKESILLFVYGKSWVSKGEWKIFEGILFCRLTVDRFKFPAFLFFIVVTYKPLARTQTRSVAEKTTSNNF